MCLKLIRASPHSRVNALHARLVRFRCGFRYYNNILYSTLQVQKKLQDATLLEETSRQRLMFGLLAGQLSFLTYMGIHRLHYTYQHQPVWLDGNMRIPPSYPQCLQPSCTVKHVLNCYPSAPLQHALS